MKTDFLSSDDPVSTDPQLPDILEAESDSMQSYTTAPDILKCGCHNCPPDGASCCKVLKIWAVNEFAQAGVHVYLYIK